MAKGVFTTKVIPSYDDLPEEKYHFPKKYLNQVKETVGDWILYYEPRRVGDGLSETGGRQSYFAVAYVKDIIEDPKLKGLYYAIVKDYLEFDSPVPFKVGQNYFENKLVKEDGKTNKGWFRHSVRTLPEYEYNQIISLGFRNFEETKIKDKEEIHEQVEEFDFDRKKIIVERPFRDLAFASNIKKAYSNTCAVTGIKLTYNEKNYEVEAAHIKPIGNKHNGPDSIRNGIALSRSFHWMFDNGLITISDDHKIITDKKLITDRYFSLINKSGRLLLPEKANLLPHRKFLKYHRENIFIG